MASPVWDLVCPGNPATLLALCLAGIGGVCGNPREGSEKAPTWLLRGPFIALQVQHSI